MALWLTGEPIAKSTGESAQNWMVPDGKFKDAAKAKRKAVQPPVQTAALPGVVEDEEEIQATWCLIYQSIWRPVYFIVWLWCGNKTANNVDNVGIRSLMQPYMKPI